MTIILTEQYVPAVSEMLLALGDPIGMQITFMLTTVSWGVAVR